MTDRLLHPNEAATILAITVKQLRLLTDQGHLRWINVGLGSKRPSRRYQIEDLEAFKAERAAKCQSTRKQAARPTPTISGYKVVDFQATLEHRRSVKQRASRRNENKPLS